jgi:hypothetical protein
MAVANKPEELRLTVIDFGGVGLGKPTLPMQLGLR